MKDLQRIVRLTIVTVFMTIGLLAFTLINVKKSKEQEMLFCGTVNIDNDGTFLNTYEMSLEHPGLKLFQANCKSCHRLDQKLIGPALRNSFESRDSIWFVNMIISANGLIDSGDTLAIRIFNDYNQTRHPDFKGLDKKQLTDLIEYFRLEGQRDIVVD